MGILRKIASLRKNRQFDYSPRYFDDKGKGNPYKVEHKFDHFRSTVGNQRGLKNKITNVVEDVHRKGDLHVKRRMLVIVGLLILVFLYIIDFDLSIFF